VDQETGECGERQLNHSDGEAEKFYRELQQRGVRVRVGMEATGHSRWFERLLAELGFEVWIGDAAEIKRQRVRKQKTDREDARLMRKLLLENRFPRIWVPVEQEANKRPEVVLLMTHPGVGPITGLVYVLVIGTPERFPCGKKIGSYTGLIPCEDSSAGRQRLGHISKQGNTLLRFLLVEAAQAAARCNPDWRRKYLHLMMRREKRIAKVAMARKLAVRLYWMWRNSWQYSQLVEFGSNAGKLGIVHGVK